ncbi:two-partner secretion domain-containing protein [Nitrospira sp. Ecomares 2.1]
MVFSMLGIHKRMLLRFFGTLIPVLTLPLTLATFSRSQVTTAITSDGTMGTAVTQIGSLHDITGGTRPGNGHNLFHSFGQFSVAGGDIANFRNNTGLPTENILSRVTGGNPSNILGTIQTQGFSNANLYIMNPAGIIFGPDASLNVGGSTHFTTADYLRLSDGIQFTALPSAQDALLTVAPVAAFGFLESNPSSIVVGGSSLSVSEGQTFSLNGGENNIIGSELNAPGGKIVLTSVASPGEVLATTYDSAPNVNGQSFTRMGNIALSEGTTLDVSGKPAGTVVIRGGQLMVDGSTISANTTGPASGLLESPGAGIDIATTGNFLIDNGSLIEANVLEGSLAGKDIFLNAGQTLEVRNNSMVHTYALGGSGNAGNIEVYADKVLMSDAFQPFESVTFGAFLGNSTGNAGNISMIAKDFQMTGAAMTATTVGGTGQAGNINVKAGEMSLNRAVISANSVGSSGNAGHVQITADKLTLRNFTNIESASFGGATGNADSVNVVVDGQLTIEERSSIVVRSASTAADGDLTIRAEDIVITGIRDSMFPLVGQAGADFTGLRTTTSNGKGADMQITARNLQLTDKAFLNASTDGPGPAGNISINLSGGLKIADGGEIRAITEGSGAAGKIEVVADSVELSGKIAFPFIERDGTTVALGFSRISAQTDDTGTGGTIGITAREINILDGGSVTSSSLGEGDGGAIRLSADTISISGENQEKTAFGVDPRSSITTENEGRIPGPEATGIAGNINIQAGTLNLEQGLVSARTASAGVGGTIEVSTSQLSLTEGSTITAGSTSTGNSGGINLKADATVLISNSDVTTEATESVGGNISLMANNVTLDNHAIVSASSSGPGNAGSIQITANDTIYLDKATVATDAQMASGGNITLTANQMIQLVDSTIASSVQGEEADTTGGDVTLDPDFIILQNSDILAKAVAGQGGNITLIANKAVLLDAQSTLDASSQTGISGAVRIESPIQVLSGTIAPLPDQPVNVATLYASRCVAGEGGHFSTFVDSKTDSVAPTPGTFLASPFLPQMSSSPAGELGHADTPSGVSGNDQTSPIRLAAYFPPMLFARGDGMVSICP